MSPQHLTVCILPLLVCALFTGECLAQRGAAAQIKQERERDPFADFLKLEARYETVRGSRQGRLIVTAQMVPGAYVYALTQQGTPPPSRIQLPDAEAYEATAGFRPDKQPTIIEHDPLFENRIEKHYGRVLFTAPIRVADDSDPTGVKIELQFHGQVCTDQGICIPIIGKRLEARWSGYFDPESDGRQAAGQQRGGRGGRGR